MGEFLKNNVIPVFITNINQNPMIMPLDIQGFIDSLHKNGINLRYMGHIYQQVCQTQNHYFKKLIERFVFVKAFVKFLRKVAIDTNNETLIALFVHLVNLFLGNQFVKQKMDKSEVKAKTEMNGENGTVKKSKKNKKKKKKSPRVEIQVSLVKTGSPQFQLTSDQFLAELKAIVSERYQFPVENINGYQDLNFIKYPKDKISFLRELCSLFGIQLLPKKYNFSPSSSDFTELPLTTLDVTGYFATTKSASYYVDLLKYNNKQIENEIVNKNFPGALHLLQATQNLIINTQGIFNKDFIFNCSKIATILFQLKELDQAVSFQLFVVRLSEAVYGIDHFNTAFSILELSNFMFEKK